jgi:hypothetical protein
MVRLSSSGRTPAVLCSVILLDRPSIVRCFSVLLRIDGVQGGPPRPFTCIGPQGSAANHASLAVQNILVPGRSNVSTKTDGCHSSATCGPGARHCYLSGFRSTGYATYACFEIGSSPSTPIVLKGYSSWFSLTHRFAEIAAFTHGKSATSVVVRPPVSLRDLRIHEGNFPSWKPARRQKLMGRNTRLPHGSRCWMDSLGLLGAVLLLVEMLLQHCQWLLWQSAGTTMVPTGRAAQNGSKWQTHTPPRGTGWDRRSRYPLSSDTPYDGE